MAAHDIEPDGYCNTCQTVPCSEPPGGPSRRTSQLDRIEHNQRRIMRHLGLEIEGED